MSSAVGCPGCGSLVLPVLLETHLRRELAYTAFECLLCPTKFLTRAHALAHFASPFSPHPDRPVDVLELPDDAKEARLAALLHSVLPPPTRNCLCGACRLRCAHPPQETPEPAGPAAADSTLLEEAEESSPEDPAQAVLEGAPEAKNPAPSPEESREEPEPRSGSAGEEEEEPRPLTVAEEEEEEPEEALEPVSDLEEGEAVDDQPAASPSQTSSASAGPEQGSSERPARSRSGSKQPRGGPAEPPPPAPTDTKWPCRLCEARVEKPNFKDHSLTIHLPFAPYQCTQCPYESKRKYGARRHLEQMHGGAGSWRFTDRRSEVAAKVVECFGEPSEAHYGRLLCRPCDRWVLKSGLRSHASAAHLGQTLHKCRLCPYTSTSYEVSRVHEHLKRAHQRRPSPNLVKSYTHRYAARVKSLVQDLFHSQ